jgi:mannosyl-oligosaccharide glucosidase
VDRIGKTHVAGFRVPAGQVWQAKGVYLCSIIASVTNAEPCADFIMQNIINRARPIMQPYQSTGPDGVPDPSFVLQLSDEILSSSNLYAVQKIFDGAFQFDVFFESASAGHKLDCELTSVGRAFTVY